MGERCFTLLRPKLHRHPVFQKYSSAVVHLLDQMQRFEQTAAKSRPQVTASCGSSSRTVSMDGYQDPYITAERSVIYIWMMVGSWRSGRVNGSVWSTQVCHYQLIDCCRLSQLITGHQVTLDLPVLVATDCCLFEFPVRWVDLLLNVWTGNRMI